VLASLGRGALVALAVVFGLVTAVFALGLVWAIIYGEVLFVVTQAVMTLAFGTLDLRVWRAVRERRQPGAQPGVRSLRP
jgi:hypothetical protein